MKALWHVSNHDGVARRCTTSPGKCPVSINEAGHHASREDAQLSYEIYQSDHLVQKKTRNKRQRPTNTISRRMIAVGTAAIAVVSLSACNTSLNNNSDHGESSTGNQSISALEQHAREEAELLYNSGEPAEHEYNEEFIDHSAENIDFNAQKEAMAEKDSSDENSDSNTETGTVDPESTDTEKTPNADNGSSITPPWEWDIFKGSADSNGNSDRTSPSDTSGIYFQGEALTPTETEVVQAQHALDTMVITPDYTTGNYNREEDFGSNTDESYEVTEQRDVTDGIFKGGRAVGGHFIDPYTGETVEIVPGSSQDTNIEHIVPLHEAYKSQDPSSPMSPEQMRSITNDPANLQITGAAVNKEKGDKDAGQWLPSYEPSQCRYAIAVITVKSDYGLTMDTVEHNAIKDVLDNRCVTE